MKGANEHVFAEAGLPSRPVAPRNLLSVSQFDAYDGVPHAGGEYVLRHLRWLAETMRINVVLPRSEWSTRVPNSWTVHYVGQSDLSARQKIWRAWWKALKGASLSADVEREFRRDSTIRQLIQNADVVEFQYLEAASVARHVRRVNPNALRVLVVHDVLTQRWARSARGAALLRMKIFYWSRFVGAAGAQARAMRAVDRVVVFSDKDAALLRPYRPRRVDVVLPPLSDRGMPSSPSEIGLVDTKSVLFTAAFDRPENLEAASWLLREVWPLVIAREPEATLTLAGVDPNGDARRLAADQTGVAATGYVNELGEFYRRSRVFVVPLRRGAGVKFKTVVAMLWGIPIVSTPIGVEGIGDDDLFVRVTDDADLFADGIVNAIVERDESAQTAGVALEWVLDRYSDRAFAAAIAPVYLDEASGDGR